MARLALLSLVALALIASMADGRQVLTKRNTPAELQPASRSEFAQQVFDSSFVEMRGGVAVWQCCRVCPQNHLLEIDQMFGSTPPPIRRYDDPQPAASTFLEEAARVAAGDASNCCNVCPTGQPANKPEEPKAEIPAGREGARRTGIRAPFKNLQFSLSRVPMPPCCPYCREQHMDEAFNLVVPPIPMRGLPYRQRRDKYSGKKVFLEIEAEVDAEAEVGAESTSESESVSSSQSGVGMTFMREYTYTAASEDNCCNRCLRAPNDVETRTAAGENMWPTNDAKQADPNAEEPAGPVKLKSAAAAEEEPAAEPAAEEAPAAE